MPTKVEPIDPQLLPPPVSRKITAQDQDTIKSLTEYKKATAWSIHRWPTDKHLYSGERVRVLLPRGYLAKGGVDAKWVYDGMDLNQFVHGWYMRGISSSKKDSGGEDWMEDEDEDEDYEGKGNLFGEADNFVAGDNICAKRHEFLGPDPRVAGYQFDYDGDVHIRWYDGFLKDQWVEKQKWTFKFVKDEHGNIVEKDT